MANPKHCNREASIRRAASDWDVRNQPRASNVNRAALLVPLWVTAVLAAQPVPAASGISDLGMPSDTFDESFANGVSADGRVVAVTALIHGYTGPYQRATFPTAYRWTANDGFVSLGGLGGDSYAATGGVSGDGSTIVGGAEDTAADGWRAFRWTQETGMQSLGVLNGGTFSMANGVASDGSVIVGYAGDGAAGDAFRAFRWTQTGGMVSLGVLNGGRFSYAKAVSADGSVVVGYAEDGVATSQYKERAFRWTEDGGMANLGGLNGGNYSYAFGVSADGKVVVGYAEDGSAPYGLSNRAFRWTQDGGMASLGVLNGGSESNAYGISADGNVVVGSAENGPHGTNRAFRWTAATGMQTVEDWLRANGVTIPSDITWKALAVNADGNVVVGELQRYINVFGTAFIARVDDGGSGLLALDDALAASLDSPSAVPLTALRSGDLLLHGAHGRPLSYRVGAGKRTAWASGDLGQDDHHPLDGDLALGEVGGGYNFGHIQANFAVGRTWADQNLTENGDLYAAGTYLWSEALVPLRGTLWGVLSAYYQRGSADVRRGYLNAGAPDASKGSPDTRTWGLRGRLEWDAIASLGGIAVSPYGELSYLHTHMDAYTERGGGFPAAYDALDDDATDLRLGVNANYPLSSKTQVFGLVEGVHRFNDSTMPITGEVIGLFPFEFLGTDYNQNWLRAGLGVAAQVGPGRISLSVNATTEGEAPDAWLAGTYQVAF